MPKPKPLAEDPTTRNRLAEEHLAIVPPLARKVWNRMCRNFELDDLIAEGNLALLAAADRFDPAQGVPFRDYARKRILGQMYDSVSRHAWEEYARGESLDILPEFPHIGQANDMEDIERRLDIKRLWRRIGNLKGKRPQILTMRYRDGYSGPETAKAVGLSEGRISQIEHDSFDTLRKAA